MEEKISLKEFLYKNRLSVVQFAQISNVPQATLYRMIQGKACSLKTLLAVKLYTDDEVDVFSLPGARKKIRSVQARIRHNKEQSEVEEALEEFERYVP